jgi:hypothetical protein
VFAHYVYFVDTHVIHSIFVKNLWYMTRLLAVAYAIFYWLPVRLFPQEHTGKGMQKIVFNFIYMIAYVEVVVTFLIFVKVFSLMLFFAVLILTKLAFLQWYYKVDVYQTLNTLRKNIILFVFGMIDNPSVYQEKLRHGVRERFLRFQQSITLYNLLDKFLFWFVFIFIFALLIARGLYSYGNPLPDTSQFIMWVDNLQHNILYADNKAFGADFYGISVLIFFVNLFTNINIIPLFSLYPILVLLMLYFSIYYVVQDFTESKYVALFAVMVHGLILMSPLSNLILGQTVTTDSPIVFDLYGLKFYLPTINDILHNANEIGYIPYIRYISGMAYEHSSIFVLLNAYFLIKTLKTHLMRYLVLYALSLMLVFTFHGGGAIVLLSVSIIIALVAFISRRVDWSIFKRVLLAIVVASIAGNMWILSMIKYGIPQDFGAAAPIIDKLLHTKHNTQNVVTLGIDTVNILTIGTFDIALFAMLAFALLFSLFTKRKFVNLGLLSIVLGIFILYFGPNAGLPLLTQQSRLAEYDFFAITLLVSFYIFYFLYKPIFLLPKKYAKSIMLAIGFAVFFTLAMIAPKWAGSTFFWTNLNSIEYTSQPNTILKIEDENQPFTWTIVAYVQALAKVKNKGYHINTQNFLLRYAPNDKYLRVPTPKIFVFVPNYPIPYMGMNQWYYRWRGKIQRELKSWIAIYSMQHNNIKVYVKTKAITVYEIDNNDYISYLTHKASNEHIRAE